MNSFIEAIKTCFQKYAVFQGEASSSEFWYFTLFCVQVLTVAEILGGDVALSLAAVVCAPPFLAVLVRHQNMRSSTSSDKSKSKMMSFKQALKSCFANLFDFKGRAQRSEFWWFFLFVQSVSWGISLLGFIHTGFNIVLIIFSLIILFPNIAVMIRRLHDMNLRGWWCILILVGNVVGARAVVIGLMFGAGEFVVAGFILLSLVIHSPLAIKGTKGANRFGDDPLEQE